MAKKETAVKETNDEMLKMSDEEILAAFDEAVTTVNEPFLFNGEEPDEQMWEHKKAANNALALSAKTHTFYGGMDPKKIKAEVEAYDAARLAYETRKDAALAQLHGGLAIDAFNAESRLSLERIPSVEDTGEYEYPTFVTKLEYVAPAQITPEMSEDHGALLQQFDKLMEKADAAILRNDERRGALSSKSVANEALHEKLAELKARREKLVLAGKDGSVLNDEMADVELAIQKDEVRARCNQLDADVLSRQRVRLQERRDFIGKVKEEVARRQAALDATMLYRDIAPLSMRLKELYGRYMAARNSAYDGTNCVYEIPYIGAQIHLDRTDDNGVPMTSEERSASVAYEDAALTDKPDGTTVMTELSKEKVVITKGRNRWVVG